MDFCKVSTPGKSASDPETETPRDPRSSLCLLPGFPPPPPRAAAIMTSNFILSPFLKTLYKWNYTLCSHLCLAKFPSALFLRFIYIACTCSLFSLMCSIPLYDYTQFIFPFFCWWVFGLFPVGLLWIVLPWTFLYNILVLICMQFCQSGIARSEYVLVFSFKDVVCGSSLYDGPQCSPPFCLHIFV